MRDRMVVTQASTYVGLSNQSSSCGILGSRLGVGVGGKGGDGQWDTRRRFECIDHLHASCACIRIFNGYAPVEKIHGPVFYWAIGVSPR